MSFTSALQTHQACLSEHYIVYHEDYRDCADKH